MGEPTDDNNNNKQEEESTVASSERILSAGVGQQIITKEGLNNDIDASAAVVKQKKMSQALVARYTKASSPGEVQVAVGASSSRQRREKEKDPLKEDTLVEMTSEELRLNSVTRRNETGGGGSGGGGSSSETMAMTRLSRTNAVGLPAGNPGAFAVLPLGVDDAAASNDDNISSSSGEDSEEEREDVEAPLQDSSGLAVATAVDGEDGNMMTEGGQRAVAEEDVRNSLSATRAKNKEQAKFICIITGLGSVAMVVFLLIFLTDDSSSSSSRNNTDAGNFTDPPVVMSPYELLYPRLHSLLPNYTLSRLGFNTSQERAFSWLAEDPMVDSYSNTRLLQRFALATFYFATGGDSWNVEGDGDEKVSGNWLNYSYHECEWEHYMPLDSKFYQNSLNFRYYDYKYIDGPCFVLNYTNHTEGNTTMMKDIEWSEFLFLAVVYRELLGEIPQEIAFLTSLKMMQFEGTTLDTTIPTFLGKMTTLEELHFPDVVMKGPIPSEVGLLTNLNVLHISGPGLTGTLPVELSELSDISVLKIVETSITGTIPTEYGKLRPKDFLLFKNVLTGTIPTELGLLTSAEWWMLDKQGLDEQIGLTGTIPTELGQLEKVLSLYFHQNSLTGTIPTELGPRMTDIKQLQIYGNKLTGSLPTELALTSDTMWRFYFFANFLTGKIPTEYGRLSQMQRIRGFQNMLSGTIPTELDGLHNIELMRFDENALTGTLPIGNWTLIKDFRLSENMLSGTIPTEYGLWNQLTNLAIRDNLISGALPSELGVLQELEFLIASFNALTGTIPEELGLLVSNGSLVSLNISGNEGLVGTLPEDFCILVEEIEEGLRRTLAFDCSERLCGCDCSCEVSTNSSAFNATNNGWAWEEFLREPEMQEYKPIEP